MQSVFEIFQKHIIMFDELLYIPVIKRVRGGLEYLGEGGWSTWERAVEVTVGQG